MEGAAPGEINAEDYLHAARGHVAALPSLYQQGDYALVIYVAGLTAECMFRAFRARRRLPFRSDHSLTELANESGMADHAPTADRVIYHTELDRLIIGWRNNHRFRSNASMRRFLKKGKLDRRIKGDFLKENARLLLQSANEIVRIGVQQWQS